MVKIGVIFYSTYGHTYKLAEKIAEGARAAGAEAELRRIAETLPKEVIEKMGGTAAAKEWEHIPIVTAEDLTLYDGIALGTPTRFGIMAAQVSNFIATLGGLWMKDSLVGKFACVFGCSGTQHGGNETTLLTTMLPLFHLGFALVGLPYSFKGQSADAEITGGSPLGITSISLNNKRQPSKIELDGAHYQGEHLVRVLKNGTKNQSSKPAPIAGPNDPNVEKSTCCSTI